MKEEGVSDKQVNKEIDGLCDKLERNEKVNDFISFLGAWYDETYDFPLVELTLLGLNYTLQTSSGELCSSKVRKKHGVISEITILPIDDESIAVCIDNGYMFLYEEQCGIMMDYATIQAKEYAAGKIVSKIALKTICCDYEMEDAKKQLLGQANSIYGKLDVEILSDIAIAIIEQCAELPKSVTFTYAISLFRDIGILLEEVLDVLDDDNFGTIGNKYENEKYYNALHAVALQSQSLVKLLVDTYEGVKDLYTHNWLDLYRFLCIATLSYTRILDCTTNKRQMNLHELFEKKEREFAYFMEEIIEIRDEILVNKHF